MSVASNSPINMDDVKIQPQAAMCLPSALAIRRQILPFTIQEDSIYVACADIADRAGLEAVEKLTGRKCIPRLAERESLRRAIIRVYSDERSGPNRRGGRNGAVAGGWSRNSGTLSLDGGDAVDLANSLLHAAILRQASDIHIEPERSAVRIRFRVDGELDTHGILPTSAHASLISRLKVLSGMDIAEKRAPQDGGFSHAYGHGVEKRAVDIRSASLPTRFGERMTLRLLSLGTESLTLDNLGMSPADHELVRQILRNPHGLLLLTGPTGSGKTTTLYAIIRQLVSRAALNIITVEDPIEYEIAGVAQVEVESGDKVNFRKALRSILRHDPDVLMIGEIRDLETLDIAIKASLTGHLVLSTLHTNSSAGVVTRLQDMGAQPYLIAATLRLCVAQRLVRRLCQHAGCRRPHPLSLAEAAALGAPQAAGREIFDAGGCLYCDGRGFSGRLGVFELMPMNAEVAQHVAGRATEEQLESLRIAQGRPTLRQDAAAKVLAGLASVTDAIEIVDML